MAETLWGTSGVQAGQLGQSLSPPRPLAGGDWQKHTGLDMTLQRESRDVSTVAPPDICPSLKKKNRLFFTAVFGSQQN